MATSGIIKGKGQYINGAWVQGKGKLLDSLNPASGTLLWQGTKASEQDVILAHDAAHEALIHWSNKTFEQRAQVALNFGKQIEKNRDALARLISQENGKPLWESYTEVKAVLDKINLSIEAFKERSWPKQFTTAEATAVLRYKPQGVVAILGPFNFPAHLSNGHIIPALLAGNTIVYKPSEQTPAVAEFIMQCWHEAPIPAGVINCLQGGAACGKWLLSLNIQAVYFTGSYSTGLSIHQQFSNQPEVLLALEMGGNNPLILDEVADLKAALYQTLLSTMISSGQRCTCARRVFIPNSSQGDEFLKQFIRLCQSLHIASYDKRPEPFMGPVISYAQAQNHLQAQQRLMQMGGESLLLMSARISQTGFLSPGIIDMTAVENPPDEEIFAPCVQIHRYTDFDEALALAKKTRYGLVAGLLSDDKERYQRFYQSIAAGLINWNRPTTGAVSSLPFGGVGWSGNHRPSAFFAADYCAYPIASMEQSRLKTPETLLPGIELE